MDDAMFELLKRIDAAFDGNLPGYGDASSTKQPALFTGGSAGDSLRFDIMRAVEAEKARRAESPIEAEKARRLEMAGLMEVLIPSLVSEGES